jgi:hypothetical protein
MGLAMMPLNTHLIQSAPQNLVGRVTSLTAAAQQVVNSFAVSGLTTILLHNMREYMANQQTPDMVNPVAAWASAFGNTFTVVIFIAIFGIIISLFLRRPKKPAEGGHMLIG